MVRSRHRARLGSVRSLPRCDHDIEHASDQYGCCHGAITTSSTPRISTVTAMVRSRHRAHPDQYGHCHGATTTSSTSGSVRLLLRCDHDIEHASDQYGCCYGATTTSSTPRISTVAAMVRSRHRAHPDQYGCCHGAITTSSTSGALRSLPRCHHDIAPDRSGTENIEPGSIANEGQKCRLS